MDSSAPFSKEIFSGRDNDSRADRLGSDQSSGRDRRVTAKRSAQGIPVQCSAVWAQGRGGPRDRSAELHARASDPSARADPDAGAEAEGRR